MACLSRPTPHRLMIMLSLILALAIAVPEIASGKHRRPKRRSSTAGFTASFIPPSAFTCSWVEVPLHDYQCAPGPGGWNPFALKLALSRGGNPPPEPPPGQEWKGLASPKVVPRFSCRSDGTGGLSAADYRCTYMNPQEHSFTVTQIVSVCDDDRVTAQGLSVCDGPLVDTPVQSYDPPEEPPAPRDVADEFFELDSWYPPDTMPPNTMVTARPSGIVASRHGSLGFVSSEDASSFECRLDGDAWRECIAPLSYEELEDGGHSFEVRATDAASNLDQTPAAVAWEVDATPPETAIVRGPRQATRDRTPSFVFVASELTATFECRMDRGSFMPCGSPHTIDRWLADGTHTFRVRASDSLGNADASPARRSFNVDRTGPRVKIAGRLVRLTRRGLARVVVRCPTSELSSLCAGKLTLKSATRVDVGSRARIIPLGKKAFRMRRGQRRAVAVKLPRHARHLVARLQTLGVRATARATDRLGNRARTSRRFVIEVPGR